MAKLGDSFSVSLPKSDSLLLGVEAYRDSDHVLITSDNKYIVLYNLQDHKVTKDWAFHGQSVSCPAVCYGDPVHFSAVINRSTIRTWSKDDINVDKSKKTSTLGGVHRLWAPADRAVAFVVYDNGSCSSIDQAKSLTVEPQLSPGDRILWSGQGTDSSHSLFILYDSQDSGDVVCVTYRWQKGTDVIVCTKDKISSADTKQPIIDCSVCQNGSKSYIYLLRVGNRLDQICINENNPLAVPTQCSSIIQGLTDCCMICAIDENQVAAMGTESKSTKRGIGMWDSKFSLLQSFCPTARPKEGSKIHKLGSSLFVSTKDGVVGIPYTLNKTTLLTALGKLQSKEVFQSSQPSEVSARPLLAKLIDKTQTKSQQQFMKTFGEFSKLLHSASKVERLKIAPDMTRLIDRIASEKFWPGPKVFDMLIETSTLQGSLLPTVIPLFIKHDDLALIHKVMCEVKDIPESVVITALEYYLRKFEVIGESSDVAMEESDHDSDDDDDDENDSQNFTNPRCPFGADDAVYLNTILTLQYNDVFMVDSIRNVGFQQILLLLKYLCYLLNETSVSKLEAQKKGIPSLGQVVEWMNMVLDAHFTQIILSPDCREILLTLSQIVESQVNFYEDLVSLESLLYQLKDKAILPKKQQVGQYCIQMLHVN